MANLFEQGLLGMGATLAARLLAGGGNYVINGPQYFYPLRSLVRYPLSTQQLVHDLVPVPDPDGPFPYGLEVEPP